MKFSKLICYVPSAIDALKFYENAFGFEIVFILESKQYGELNTGDTTLAFATNEPDQDGTTGPLDKEHIERELQFITNDVSLAFEKAVRAGGAPLKEPVQNPSGQTVALVKAIDGAFIELITPM